MPGKAPGLQPSRVWEVISVSESIVYSCSSSFISLCFVQIHSPGTDRLVLEERHLACADVVHRANQGDLATLNHLAQHHASVAQGLHGEVHVHFADRLNKLGVGGVSWVVALNSRHRGLPMLDFTSYCRQFLFSGRQIPRRFPSETASLVKISISLLQANNPVAGGALDSGNRPAPVGVAFSTR